MSFLFEQIALKAIAKVESDPTPLSIEGTSSLSPLLHSLTQKNSQLYKNHRHLVLAETETQGLQIQEWLQKKGVASCYLPDFDVSPYSGLSPKSSISPQRVGFLHHISSTNSSCRIFIATLKALSLKSLTPSYLKENTYRFKVGDTLPEPIDEFLSLLGYKSTSIVEQYGQYSHKGGILDLFSPAHSSPLRIELFSDEIHSLRFFNVETQRSEKEGALNFDLLPAKECFYKEEHAAHLLKYISQMVADRKVPREDIENVQLAIRNSWDFLGQDFLISGFWPQPELIKNFIAPDVVTWLPNKEMQLNAWQKEIDSLRQEYERDLNSFLRPEINEVYETNINVFLHEHKSLLLNDILIKDLKDIENISESQIDLKYSCSKLKDFIAKAHSLRTHFKDLQEFIQNQFIQWNDHGFRIFVSCPQDFAYQRAQQLCAGLQDRSNTYSKLDEALNQTKTHDKSLVFFIREDLFETIKLNDEKFILINFKDLYSKSISSKKQSNSSAYFKKLDAIRFGELSVGDFVVHVQHGLAKFNGLVKMDIQSTEAEFLELQYKGKDKLYLPVHRINHIKLHSGPKNSQLLDKLGSGTWEKSKIKVKNHLRDIADDLLKLYAQRSVQKRTPYSFKDEDLFAFENEFPFSETEDQEKAINDIQADLLSEKPMDRLICGDVGFGKTEVALRAAFQVLQSGKQVAVLAPTTVLAFQHYRSFHKRLAHWGFNIKGLHRFVDTKNRKQTISDLKNGQVDLVVGTHRLLSQDISFNRLGLLICDEEQKFGVRHKEKIRRFKAEVDTLTLSATPIPRTLNMGLMGLRDLSLISTAPVDRQATRTFITKFSPEIIKKAIYTEVERGGQVYFVHNRVQSIYGLYEELKSLMPDLRIAVGHGQMKEQDLEKVMLSFFNHEIDVLLSTTIIESGVDIPNANTMFIDNAQQFGLSQLYQLRGRVGRSKNKAYCYLIIPKSKQIDKEALERLKILQENTALGSGIRVAHYDLELRGAGNLLGEDQSGHVNIVGYDLYMELLQESLAEAQGQEVKPNIDPDINVPISSLIPSDYISDIRIRLSFYKALSSIESEEDLGQIEDELSDQYGPLPEQVLNLFSMTLVKKVCREKGIKEVSTGPKNLSLKFDPSTNLSIDRILKLSQQENKKYKLLPEDRLIIRMNEITWPRIYEEIQYL